MDEIEDGNGSQLTGLERADGETIETPKGDQQDANRRSADRRRVLKGIKVSFGQEFCAVEGVMRNLSETGALIELKDGFIVPDHITIHNELDGYKIDCKVARRQGNRIGVKFVGSRSPIEASRHQVISTDIGRHQAEKDPEPDPVSDPEPEPQQQEEESRFSLRQRPAFGKLHRD